MTLEKTIEFGKIFLKSIENEKGSATYEFVEMAIKALKEEPYEKFENVKDHIYKLASDYKCWDNRLTHDEAIELCHTLEQEDILDKIRAEIENHCGLLKDNHCKYCSYCNSVMGVREILEVIDKYRESEGK